MGGVCNFLSSVLLQQKFEAMDGPVLQLGVKAQFYLAIKGEYIFKAWEWADPKEVKWSEEKRSERFNFGFFFTCGSHSSPRTFLYSIFAGFFLSLSFSHCYFGLLFPILTTSQFASYFLWETEWCTVYFLPQSRWIFEIIFLLSKLIKKK